MMDLSEAMSPPEEVQEVSLSFARSPGDVASKKILLIYTGGTIGMAKREDGSLQVKRGFIAETLNQQAEMRHHEVPLFDILEWQVPMDSSDFSPLCWIKIAKQIERHYLSYDGFVVLHGTDTMCYTASALSFMLENLTKPVILTGAMIPLQEPVSDAKRNLLISMMCAGNMNLNEVCIYFNTSLMRGNRSKKIDPWNTDAMHSPNMEPLATTGVGVYTRPSLWLPYPGRRLVVHTSMHTNIVVLSLVPGFNDEIFHLFTRPELNKNGSKLAIVLLLYGSGNAPVHKEKFHSALSACIKSGNPIVIISQCQRGSVDLGAYESGIKLSQLGVIDGKDMTIEAASTKLAYLMGRGITGADLKTAMEKSIRGELSEKAITPYMSSDTKFVSRL